MAIVGIVNRFEFIRAHELKRRHVFVFYVYIPIQLSSRPMQKNPDSRIREIFA